MLSIRIQFRSTQNPFTLILNPMSIDEALATFDVGQFIVVGMEAAARATSGKHVSNMVTAL